MELGSFDLTTFRQRSTAASCTTISKSRFKYIISKVTLNLERKETCAIVLLLCLDGNKKKHMEHTVHFCMHEWNTTGRDTLGKTGKFHHKQMHKW